MTLVGAGSYPSAETQSMYSTAPADWVSSYLGLLDPFVINRIWHNVNILIEFKLPLI